MSDIAKIGNCAKILRGLTFSPTQVSQNKDINSIGILRAGNIQDNLDIEYNVLNINKNRVDDKILLLENDIIMCTSSGSPNIVGKTAFIEKDIPYTVGAFCAIIRADSLKIQPKYLFYYLNSPNFKNWSKKSQGINIKNINLTQLGGLNIPIPPITDQLHIASTLDKVDAIIRKRKESIRLLDELIKAKFVEMFGDIKLNTKKWETIELSKIAQVKSSIRVFVDELKTNGIPFFRGTEIGELAEDKYTGAKYFISEEHYNNLINNSGKPKEGDILLPSICPDGRIWVINSDKPFYFKDGRVLWIHNIINDFDPLFLRYYLMNKLILDYDYIASGITFNELKIFSLKKINIFKAPIELQKKFSQFAQKVLNQKNLNKTQLHEAETLKAALMQKYFPVE